MQHIRKHDKHQPSGTDGTGPDVPELTRRTFLLTSAVGSASIPLACGRAGGRLLIRGRRFSVRVRNDLGLEILNRDGGVVWETSRKKKPQMTVVSSPPKREVSVELEQAERRVSEPYAEGDRAGYRVVLSSFPGTDVRIELLLAMEDDELLVQVAQKDGEDRLRGIDHLYCLEKPTSEGGYLLLPHGSGYLIPADLTEELPASISPQGNLVWGRYSLPLFALVKDRYSLYTIVESFWDCSVDSTHLPGQVSSLDFNWLPSLGKIGYPRRFLMRFAEDLDYVGIAKAYRKYVQGRGRFRTLREKQQLTPSLKRYIQGFEYRWIYWQPDREAQVLNDIRDFQKEGLKVNFFFPKWSSGTPEKSDANSWQAFLREEPVPGGWETLVRLAQSARDEGALIKIFINPNANLKGAPGYDPAKASRNADGGLHPCPTFWGDGMSPAFGPESLRRALDSAQSHGFQFDALYFDGYALHGGHPEDFSPQHPVTRRGVVEKQQECLRVTRDRGLIPGAELARFWCIPESDFFFFTDWSRDILPVGEPVPLFQLVFHECYVACFSGGGYGKYDWPETKNPRLYELLFGAAPGYNWMLPYGEDFPGYGLEGSVPIQEWDSPAMRNRMEWLKRWSAYFQATTHAEMTSHEFLNERRTWQRVRFSNGVEAEFDMEEGLCRVSGVDGFSGDWEQPHPGRL